MTAKVSVIIPIYNSAPWLRRCLDSVCGQTLKDLEIICVNDGSTDKSADILEEYASRDNRILPINFGKNQGVSVARNVGMSAANAEWLGFVDSDDTIDENFYAALWLEAATTRADMVEAPICVVDEAGKKNFYPQWTWFYSSLFRTDFLRNNTIAFPIQHGTSEDEVFMVNVLLSRPIRRKICDANYNYYQISTSVSHHLTENKCEDIAQSFFHVFADIKQFADSKKISSQYAQNVFCVFFKHFQTLINHKFTDEAKAWVSNMLVEFYTDYPYRGQTDRMLKESDPVALECLENRNAAKLTTYFLNSRHRFAAGLRARLNMCRRSANN